uniref:Uncharacterized protein n=1 Tax=viral metagenome TaxID=1070528 RepID=A0A6M3M8V6_9ZZZZ
MTQLQTYTITVNSYEAGVLMGMMEKEGETIKQPLSHVWQQLVRLKKAIEKADGVVKKILPNGMLELTDEDGNRIIRPPYSWEIEDN